MESRDGVSPDGSGPPLSDRSLLRRLRGGCEDAATQLYLRYAHRLRALVRARCSPQVQRRVEPEDLVQSVFRRFFRRVQQGDYDVPAGEELWGLFLVIALNRIRAEESFQRAAKRDLRRAEEGSDRAREAASAQDDQAFTILQLTIKEAMAQLGESQQRMLELRVQGHEVAEIAQLTGRSKRTIERILQEIRTRLRSLLEVPAHHESDPPPPVSG